MKVSIITVVYNGASTIQDCIESVLGQTYPNIEYIIIDGLSKDNTEEIVKKYGTKIAVFISEKDAGIYDAMNKGIALATGDVIGILNADDFYHSPDVVQKVVKIFQNSQADAVYGDLIYVNADDTNKIERYWKSGAYAKSRFLYGWMPPHPTFFLKRKCYEAYGGYRTDLGSAADYELMLRMAYKHQIRLNYLPAIITKMRMGGVSNSTVVNRLKANQSDRQAWVLNGLRPYWFTLWLKPIRKISQFIYRPKLTAK
ncbi:MAG: glycosyltransferase family 2 protein [Runella sp.]